MQNQNGRKSRRDVSTGGESGATDWGISNLKFKLIIWYLPGKTGPDLAVNDSYSVLLWRSQSSKRPVSQRAAAGRWWLGNFGDDA